MDIRTEIFNAWCIHPSAVKGWMPTIVNSLLGTDALAQNSVSNFSELRKMYREQSAPKLFQFNSANHSPYECDNDSYKNTVSNAPPNSLAVITVSGPIVKESQYCGPKGTAETVRELKQAGNNPNIVGVLFKVNSPGGSVSGTEILSNTVRDFESNYNKPLIGYIDDMACSAGYWIVSGAKTIYVSSRSAQVGCIGTMLTMYNYEQWLANQGLEEIVLRASQSGDKNEAYYAALRNEPEKMIRQLDKLNVVFLGGVRRNRSGKLIIPDNASDNPLRGGTFSGLEAVNKYGLADKFGTEDQALSELTRIIQRMDRDSVRATEAHASAASIDMDYRNSLPLVMSEDDPIIKIEKMKSHQESTKDAPIVETKSTTTANTETTDTAVQERENTVESNETTDSETTTEVVEENTDETVAEENGEETVESTTEEATTEDDVEETDTAVEDENTDQVVEETVSEESTEDNLENNTEESVETVEVVEENNEEATTENTTEANQETTTDIVANAVASNTAEALNATIISQSNTIAALGAQIATATSDYNALKAENQQLRQDYNALKEFSANQSKALDGPVFVPSSNKSAQQPSEISKKPTKKEQYNQMLARAREASGIDKK